MDITNSNYTVLHKNILKEGDIVRFVYNSNTYTYIVKTSYLDYSNGWNSEIFTQLQLQKYQVATKAYGYLSDDGGWPQCRASDYAALTRLVLFLFEEIERREKPETFIKPTSSNIVKIKISIEPQIKIKLK